MLNRTTPSIITRSCAVVLIAVASAASLTACDQVSDDTKAKAAHAACSSADANISSLEAGGAGAKVVASLIHDASTDEQVRAAAKKVMEGKADTDATKTLTGWLNEVCG